MKQRRNGMPLVALVFAVVASLAPWSGPPPAHADACHTWWRTLKLRTPYMRGEDVRQLQIRIAGWGGFRNYVDVDGVYRPETKAAVERFQRAYRLPVNGIAGPRTFAKIYALQDADCTPRHFAFEDFAVGGPCGEQDFGANLDEHDLSADAVKANLLRVMWKLEALHRQLDLRDGLIEDTPLVVTSGFRSHQCQLQVNPGTHPSQHEYGLAADLAPPGYSLCAIARQAQFAGFSIILGPGYPGHDDHVHLDLARENPALDGDGRSHHLAPTCGVDWNG